LDILLRSLAKAIRLTDELQDVRLVRQPIEQGCRQPFVNEDFMMPLSWIA
jgi:hypothetical protein